MFVNPNKSFLCSFSIENEVHLDPDVAQEDMALRGTPSKTRQSPTHIKFENLKFFFKVQEQGTYPRWLQLVSGKTQECSPSPVIMLCFPYNRL